MPNTDDDYRNLGLSREEVRQRIANGAVNRVDSFTTRSSAAILRNNVLTLFTVVLALAVAALLVVGADKDAVFLAGVTVANSLAGMISEFRAKRALDHLAILARRKVTAIRAGKEESIWLDEAVKDELLILRPGDPVIADGPLIAATGLFLDESLLTGESGPVAKQEGDRVFSGTYVAQGTGRYQAERIGPATNANALAIQAKAYKIFRTPLEQVVGRVIRALVWIMMLFVFLLLLANAIQRPPLATTILEIATMIKALVPEGLVLVTTVAFAVGALRAARRDVLVQKLNAIESLSQVNILCLDKTGTLGTNHLRFERLEVLAATPAEVTRLLRAFVGTSGAEDETLRALAAPFPGLPGQVLDEIPFSSESKQSAVRLRDGNAEVSLWLGAPESLAPGSTPPALDKKLSEWRQAGFRVLAFARSTAPLPQLENLETLAFIILRDELRSNVQEAVDFFIARGIDLKVLSGDHPETVAALSRQAGIPVTIPPLTGKDLEALPPDAFAAAVLKSQIFGRLAPRQKQRIIQSLQETGACVGMVGDGMNDVLALKHADIGIAMKSGAAAARDVADIVLLKDSFAHLPTLSREGDRIIYNVKRVAKLVLTKNVYCLFFVLFSGFVGLIFPLSPRFITWIDVLTIGTPAFLLTLMSAPVPKQSSADFLRETLGFAAISGLIIALVSLAVYANFSLWQDRMENYGKTAALSAIVLMGLYAVYRVTAPERSPAAVWWQTAFVWIILALGASLNILAIYWAPIRDLLGLAALDADSWLTIFIAAALGSTAMHLRLKDGLRRRARVGGETE
ncbi:MAG: cation-translocating P-type ATPase [Acidithiobacillus sp.]